MDSTPMDTWSSDFTFFSPSLRWNWLRRARGSVERLNSEPHPRRSGVPVQARLFSHRVDRKAMSKKWIIRRRAGGLQRDSMQGGKSAYRHRGPTIKPADQCPAERHSAELRAWLSIRGHTQSQHRLPGRWALRHADKSFVRMLVFGSVIRNQFYSVFGAYLQRSPRPPPRPFSAAHRGNFDSAAIIFLSGIFNSTNSI